MRAEIYPIDGVPMRQIACVLLLFLAAPGPVAAGEADTDHDGLSDFLEIHKYRTDPVKADSDGDGVPDGDWHERREFAYTVRSVVKVLRPCVAAFLNDDYQDARILRETDEFVELEVIHYPVNTIAAAIDGSREWQKPAPELGHWLKSGITTNWDDRLKQDLLAALQQDGFDVSMKTDAAVVRHVVPWLLKRGTFQDVFGTYFVDFADDKPGIMPGLEQAFKDYNGGVNARLPLSEHFEHELFGKGMFYNKCYGTCTSTATYLTTGLRAVGIPTRMVLAIPVVDANDGDQLKLVERGISNHALRKSLLQSLPGATGFSAHTFNEVYIDGRWRRLNYNQLGANIDSTFGLMTHVHTFADLSEAGLARTWGWRYGTGMRSATFKTSNPYCATEISDRFGIYCDLSNPEPEKKEHSAITITKAYWPNTAAAPASVKSSGSGADGSGFLFVHGDEWFKGEHYTQYKIFMGRADPEFKLVSQGAPDVKGSLSSLYITNETEDLREIEIKFKPAEFEKLRDGVEYRLVPVNSREKYQWIVPDGVRVMRPSK
jgi:hypothetical protein